jgi:hypothetical protein
MTLITFDSGRTLLIDCHIRKAADDPDDDTPDVAGQLRDRLKTDSAGRPYLDAMLLSHPDKDHCSGLETHFHLGPLADYVDDSDKIVIREQWSSPIVFRRTSNSHTLCPDAKAWAKEARRRVARFREFGQGGNGDRIRILGEDVDGKTDDLTAILTKAGETLTMINGVNDGTFEAFLLAPRPPGQNEEDEEDILTKNNSSVIMRFKLTGEKVADACRFLTGGDAMVAIWERLWKRYKNDADDKLGYDLLQSPHHCSWHSLSWDSWSEYGEDAEVSADARKALGQARQGATIVASSKTIVDDDSDPPCVRAEREYKAILKPVKGSFVCVGDGGPEPLAYEVKAGGLASKVARAAAVLSAPALIGAKPVGHG